MTAADARHFDQRYGGSAYWYGTEPNDFLREHAPVWPKGARILCLGEGEGRNAVFLARRGCRVTALDCSTVGLAKAAQLASSQGVAIETVHADLADYAVGRAVWDGIVSIWCHLEPRLRARVHAAVVAALRPGGTFLLEAYTPAQLGFGSGGPSQLELLPTLAMLRAELEGLRFEMAVEREREIHEGKGHNGPSAVVQLLGRAPE
jgi:SAM-dependent methyltransferase